MSVILLRHTRPDVTPGTCYGRTDLDLAPEFAAEVVRIASELPEVSKIISSPLSRCRRLAEAIAERRGRDVEIDERVIEMDFGAWEQVAWDAIPRDQIDAWRDDFRHGRPHGGESVHQLAERVEAAMADHAGAADPALIVTHSGVIKAALAAQGVAGAWQADTPFGHWKRIDWR